MNVNAAMKLLKRMCVQVEKDFISFGKLSDDARTRNYISSRLSILEDNFRNICEHRDDIDSSDLEEEVLKLYEDSYDKVMETYLLYKSTMLDELDRLDNYCSPEHPSEEKDKNQHDSVNSKDQAHEEQQDNSVATKNSINFNEIRLPCINPPIFSGAYDRWRSFHDLFVALVHNNSSLSEIQKLHYLKSSVTGEAERLLQHLSIDNGNYQQAWSIPTSRYDHKRILVNTQLRIFFEQPTIHAESSNAIKGLLDKSTEVLHSLTNLGVPIDHWDVVVIYTLLQKLPACTQQMWEEKLGMTKELPTFTEFSSFLETRFRSLEVVDQFKPKSRSSLQRNQGNHNVLHVKPTNREKFTCSVCHNGQHSLRTCNSFIRSDYYAKQRTVKQLGVCENCLAYSHKIHQCPSQKRCYYCRQKHHSLLHHNTERNHTSHISTPQSDPTSSSSSVAQLGNANSTPQSIAPNTNEIQSCSISTQVNPNALSFNPHNVLPGTSSSIRNHHISQHTNIQILLSTAVVGVKSSTGKYIHLRALIDSGSEATFITEAAARLLGLKKHRTSIETAGLGNVKNGSCKNYVDLNLRSTSSEFETETRALVFKTLTGLLPNKEVITTNLHHIQGLNLADPMFHKPASVDLLLGNEIYCDVVLPEIIRGEQPIAPIAQNSRLGWIISGRATLETEQVNNFCQRLDIDTELRKFWEIEEAPFKELENEEDAACEEHFRTHTKRSPGGRFEVSLPFKDDIHPSLGSSQEGALRRFHQLERRFDNNPTLHNEYKKCIEEYLQLGQMVMVDISRDKVLKSPYHYVVPHHAVFKESSTTTKLRVVFDAAFKTTDGTSLNDHLMVGPKTQANIIDIILKWRRYKVTLTADIEKMYRQINVSQADSYYQLIYWRENKTAPIKMYRLRTVTFGTASAPYLATRTLNKLADDERQIYPLAAQMIREDMYVDDLVTGADSVQEAQEKLTEITNLLGSAGFHLRKWASNREEILSLIEPSECEVDFMLPFDSSDHVKTLGIKWLPSSDTFSFQWVSRDSTEVTKRTMLSTIAKLFDPLGWISPCVIWAKILMQRLWLSGLTWDDPIPLELQKEWVSYRAELPLLEDIRIQRWIFTQEGNNKYELHGFSDASMKAYGAVVYLRVLDSQNNIHMNLIISKTRVAPLNTVSLPRLELCGAVLLARLLSYTARVLQLGNIKIFAYTDSTISLCWIKSPPSKWKTFISNRVAEIQRHTNINIWKHVPTHTNPADLASRGVFPSELQHNDLWWKGPEFLRTSWHFCLPNQPSTLDTEEEIRPVKIYTQCVMQPKNEFLALLDKHSELQKLLRIMSYCWRFIYNTRKPPQFRILATISPSDMQRSTLTVLRLVQQEMFPKELIALKRQNQPSTLKPFRSLNPFIDNLGILRVGGRLQNSDLEVDQQHPIILRTDHHFTQLLIRDAHERTFHGGVQQMTAYLRNKYWIFNLKRSVKKYVHRCVICYRYKAKPMQQLMGNLPAPRVRISRPFTHTGVDYAGPMDVKAWKGRGGKIYKGYFAIFVCLATKAIHLEAVSDMTTQAFLAAFRRFTARRGICAEIYSDCGKNFVGANQELQRMLKAANLDWTEIATTSTNIGTKWNFIPPASPHFGGLWEAGVKSVKFHLKRVIKNETLTFEELSTLLAQIEACLNSRPLCPLTENIDDFTALTPAHFLIGTSAQLIPQADQTSEKVSYIDRWKRIQVAVHNFWKHWSGEYLARLQQRPKWLNIEAQPKIDDLVLLKDERLPPSKWRLGRISATYPGADNMIRVVKLRTENGECKRPITKICRLPSNKTTVEDSTI